jgi:spore coat protein CotH
VLLAGSVLLAGCGASGPPAAAPAAVSAVQAATATGSVFDATQVHAISLAIDPEDYTAMIEAYTSGGDKDWAHATATIDGQVFRDVGVRLKGNLTLRSVDLQTDPSEVPFMIELDEFVKDQSLDGYTRFAVRSSTSTTALEEAVALDLLGQAGLASTKAVASSFSVNGSAARLRLVVQDLDETWESEHFATDGALYKAEAGGDYSYRGDDPAAYDGVFDQKTGEDDLGPVIDLVQFLEEATDAEVAAELPDLVDVQAFATYVAFEGLIGNSDDIEGGGNNSFLRWDAETGRFTVVAWDHNSAFGAGLGPGGARGGMGGGGGGPGGGGSRTNALLQRFTAVPAFAALVAAATADLTGTLYASGAAETALARWVQLLQSQASGLVTAQEVATDAARVRSFFA